MRALTCIWLLALGCGTPELDRPKDMDFLPSPDDSPPPAPLIESFPATTPHAVATIRGTAVDARRVIIESGTTTIAELVLPDGSFCVDVPLAAPGVAQITVWAQSQSGAVSASAAELTVERDPAAARGAVPSLCSGSDPAYCSEPKAEVCDNGVDDDCNGRTDGLDPSCADCGDDLLEPNDEPTAPRIDPGDYSELMACPNDPDYYAVALSRYDDLTVAVDFDHADGDIDLRLFDIDRETVLERSASVTSNELVQWRAETDGIYLIKVYGFGSATNSYEMQITVD